METEKSEHTPDEEDRVINFKIIAVFLGVITEV